MIVDIDMHFHGNKAAAQRMVEAGRGAGIDKMVLLPPSGDSLPVYIQASLIDHQSIDHFCCNAEESLIRDIASAIGTYPDNKFIVGFAARGGNRAIELLGQLLDCRNFFIETSVEDAAPFDAMRE